MSRVTDILTNVRDILADPDKTRWDDPTLVRLLNAGIKDFVVATECLKEKLFVELEENVSTYNLSQYVLKFLRVQHMDIDISAKTHMELDSIDINWQTATGSKLLHCTFDGLKSGSIRVYPILDNATNIVSQNSLYGGLIDIEIIDNLFTVPTLENADSEMSNYLTCYIVKKPNIVTLSTSDADFELDSMYDRALEYFVSGNALRMDSDTINRQFGAEQIQLYSQYVNNCIVTVSKSSSAVMTRTIPYRGFQ